YRAGRVRAIFSLPPGLVHLYDGPLVYLDVFSPFSPDCASTHCMYNTTLRDSGTPGASLVLPLTYLKLACHLAPDFSSPVTHPHGSAPGVLTHVWLLFNDFYNHHMFLLMSHWQSVSAS
ncbi:hypothetical protein FRC12_005055, partial [Ceratobasidium sp. 428]